MDKKYRVRIVETIHYETELSEAQFRELVRVDGDEEYLADLVADPNSIGNRPHLADLEEYLQRFGDVQDALFDIQEVETDPERSDDERRLMDTYVQAQRAWVKYGFIDGHDKDWEQAKAAAKELKASYGWTDARLDALFKSESGGPS